MPRTLNAPAVTSLVGAEAKPFKQGELAPFDETNPDHVACSRCGEASSSDGAKCKSCGLAWDDLEQHDRSQLALRQRLSIGERQLREQVAASRAPDPDKASNVVGALALVVHDLETGRDAAAVEVTATKDRLDLAFAARWANDSTDNRLAVETAQLAMLGAPDTLLRWESALKDARALQPIAEEADELYAAGPTASDFRAQLDQRMAAARVHLDAAFKEIAAAYDEQRQHEAGVKAAHAKRAELEAKLVAIKPRPTLKSKLVYGIGHIHNHETVSDAAARALIGAVSDSKLERGLAENLRLNIKWKWQQA